MSGAAVNIIVEEYIDGWINESFEYADKIEG